MLRTYKGEEATLASDRVVAYLCKMCSDVAALLSGRYSTNPEPGKCYLPLTQSADDSRSAETNDSHCCSWISRCLELQVLVGWRPKLNQFDIWAPLEEKNEECSCQ